MIRALTRNVLAVVLCTIVFGLAFPLLITGVAQAFFSSKADGSVVKVDGRVVGSHLVAQDFKGTNYFHPRPSGTAPAYNAAATTFANLGPTNSDLARAVRERALAIVKLEGPYNPGLTIGDIPVDAVTTSGSGIDPHISPAYARLQAARVARVRGIPRQRVFDLISAATAGRSLGLFGEPGVNVLDLNLALGR